MAMQMLETPSRIWRRIQEVEDRDMPSLPSIPVFDDESDTHQTTSESEHTPSEQDLDLSFDAEPIHSTPVVTLSAASTVRPTIPATNSATRFAQSIALRSSKSSSQSTVHPSISTATVTQLRRSGGLQQSRYDSFDVSAIPSLPAIETGSGDEMSDSYPEVEEKQSASRVYLPEELDEDISLTEDALESVSRSPSPVQAPEKTPRKSFYDFSVSLKSEPKPSPYDKFRNVALRKPGRTRTPSLSRTTPSPLSSPTNSTPQSNRSFARSRQDISPLQEGASQRSYSLTSALREAAASPSTVPLPRSRTASPAVQIDRNPHESDLSATSESRSEPTFSSTESGGPALSQYQASRGTPSPYNMTRRNPTSPALSSLATPMPRRFAPSSPSLDPALTTPLPPDEQSMQETSRLVTTTPADPPPFETESEAYTDQEESAEEDKPEAPVTPHSRRRSFLLSVINSTARPTIRRLNAPRPRGDEVDVSMDPTATPAAQPASLRIAFAGVTPRPRMSLGGGLGRVRGTPHPLTIEHTVAEEDSESDPPNSVAEVPMAVTPLPRTRARTSLSPYVGDNQSPANQSYVSTASSHDLTTHHPVNASFDPLMMPGGVGAVGRFNKGKLNTYLYSLNRRLEEENKVLLDRIAALEEATPSENADPIGLSPHDSRRQSSAFSRRLSTNQLNDVEEEGWLEEKVELEARVESLQSEVLSSQEALEAAEQRLQEETQARSKDKDRWKERMVEVENGVERIVGDLERQLRDAERRVSEREHTIEEERGRALNAEKLLEGQNDLGGELKRANERVSELSAELAHSQTHIEGLEDQLDGSQRRVEQLETEMSAKDGIIKKMEDGRRSLESQLLEATTAKDEAEEELLKVTEYMHELEEDAEAAVQRAQELEDALNEHQAAIQELNDEQAEAAETIKSLQDDVDRQNDLAAQMQEALDIAQKQTHDDEEKIYQFKSKVSSLERENQRLLERSNASSQHAAPAGPTDADVEALEDELDAANKEIARLNTLLSQSPARKALDHAKDARIEILEKEKEELTERIKALKFSTPNRTVSISGISPAHRQVLANLSMRTPKTPGAPLRDLTWLNTTFDASVSPLLDEVARLQKELDRANESIDDKLDELEEAGMGVVDLNRKLEDSRARIRALEDEIARLCRREERRVRRLERMKCRKCNVKVDTRAITDPSGDEESSFFNPDESALSEASASPSKTKENLKSELKHVNALLSDLKEQWQEEKQQLLGEKLTLQDATNRLAHENRDAKEKLRKQAQSQRVQEGVAINAQNELEAARVAIAGLEDNLKAERAQIRAMSSTQNHIAIEKDVLSGKLRGTEVDMEEVKKNLRKVKENNQALEEELRGHSHAEQKAKHLEGKLSANAKTIKDLRHERSLLAADYQRLQKQFTEITERASSARAEQSAWQVIHDNHQHQLSLQVAEIADLKHALSEQAEGARRVEKEKNRMASEKSDFVRIISELQVDLKRVRREAETFGQDLKVLRRENEQLENSRREDALKADRARKQSQTQIRLLNEQVAQQKDKLALAKVHVESDTGSMAEIQINALKIQHNKECKGLSLQIGYLKAKFTRESLLRNNLVWQKNYLLILLEGFERSDKNICAAIAKIGFPVSPPKQRRRTLKAVAHCVIFLSRAKVASRSWQKERAVRGAIQDALKAVRLRRAKSST